MKKLLTIITATLLLLGSSSAWAGLYDDVYELVLGGAGITVKLRDSSLTEKYSNNAENWSFVKISGDIDVANDGKPQAFPDGKNVFVTLLSAPSAGSYNGEYSLTYTPMSECIKLIFTNGDLTHTTCAAPEPTVSLAEGDITMNSIQVTATTKNFSGTPSYSWRYKQTGGSYTSIAATTSTIIQSGLKKATSYTFECTATYQDETDTKDIVIETADEKGDIDVSVDRIQSDLWIFKISGTFNYGHTFTLTAIEGNPTGLTFERYNSADASFLNFKCLQGGSVAVDAGDYKFKLLDVTTNECSVLNFNCAVAGTPETQMKFKSATACTVPETEAEFPFTKTSLNQKTLAVSTTGNIKSVAISQNGEQKRYFEGSGATSQNVDISNLASGTYTVTLTAEGSGNLKVLNSVY
ncbi:MAG: hypothetical protein MJ003_01635 [Paludibacteraceae bacterium]|nr:hypothetical protein [Paludibacteraceae bacterium]